MKSLFLSLLLLLSMNSQAFQVSEKEAIEVAKEYVYGLGEEIYQWVETSVEEELSTVWFERNNTYFFVMHDGSGDCGFVVAVNYNGSINTRETYEDWSCY